MLYIQGNTYRAGVFTFTDTEITFIPDRTNTWTGWTQKYTFDDNSIVLIGDKVRPEYIFRRR